LTGLDFCLFTHECWA